MRKCPRCGKVFSKGKWMLGLYDIRCPFCNEHLKLDIGWKISPLILGVVLCGALCTYHYIFKVLVVILGLILWLYLCNLPYKKK